MANGNRDRRRAPRKRGAAQRGPAGGFFGTGRILAFGILALGGVVAACGILLVQFGPLVNGSDLFGGAPPQGAGRALVLVARAEPVQPIAPMPISPAPAVRAPLPTPGLEEPIRPPKPRRAVRPVMPEERAAPANPSGPDAARGPVKPVTAAPRAVPETDDGALANFFGALRALEAGTRAGPVRILHLGDSHIAGDAFTRVIRRQFQVRFGDAGRGLMQPPNAFRWHRVDGMEMRSEGWTAYNSLTHKSGPYGITGVRVETERAGAVMEIDARKERFDRATVRYLVRPGGGRFELQLGNGRQMIDTRAARSSVRTAVLEGRGEWLRATALGGGPVTVFGWSLEKAQPGVQYINLGIPGAAAYVAQAWSPAIVASDIKALAPDLIIFGYGSNEAFNVKLTRSGYRRHVRRLMGWLRRAAPQASLLVLALADGLRRAGSGPVGERVCGHEGEAAWHALPRMGTVRAVGFEAAEDFGTAYWDWTAMMGGPCAIMRWAGQSPALAARDRLHLTARGYDRSSAALYRALLEPFDDGGPVVAEAGGAGP